VARFSGRVEVAHCLRFVGSPHPAGWFAGGKDDPGFASRPQLAADLVEQAVWAAVPFAVVVADSAYGPTETTTLVGALRQAGMPYVLALKPRLGIWARADQPAHSDRGRPRGRLVRRRASRGLAAGDPAFHDGQAAGTADWPGAAVGSWSAMPARKAIDRGVVTANSGYQSASCQWVCAAWTASGFLPGGDAVGLLVQQCQRLCDVPGR
jgi:hypothetical protein